MGATASTKGAKNTLDPSSPTDTNCHKRSCSSIVYYAFTYLPELTTIVCLPHTFQGGNCKYLDFPNPTMFYYFFLYTSPPHLLDHWIQSFFSDWVSPKLVDTVNLGSEVSPTCRAQIGWQRCWQPFLFMQHIFSALQQFFASLLQGLWLRLCRAMRINHK